MSTGHLTAHPVILPKILAERLWGERDFSLIDVGASGGLEKHWQQFGDRLTAVGFEPLVVEAERLQKAAEGTKVRYEAAFVTCRNFDTLFPPDLRNDRTRSRNNDPFTRSSAAKAQALMMNYIEQVFNSGAPAVYSDRYVVLDEYIPAAEQPFVDFIKIDTDGHDYEVLLGAEGLLEQGGALGFSVEAQFHGASHDCANTFSNIDRFLRGHGFSLFDMEIYRYSRSVLPAPFVHDLPAQTVTGQVFWGEVVYFRDLGDPDYERKWPYEMTRERVLKLACLYDLFGLPDCAAELLLERRALVEDVANDLLDSLASHASPSLSYDEFIRRFEADPKVLYASARHDALQPPGVERQEPSGAPPSASSELRRLRKRLERQEKKIAELQERVRRRDDRIAQLTETAGQKIV